MALVEAVGGQRKFTGTAAGRLALRASRDSLLTMPDEPAQSTCSPGRAAARSGISCRR